jgi:hypothetical protein
MRIGMLRRLCRQVRLQIYSLLDYEAATQREHDLQTAVITLLNLSTRLEETLKRSHDESVSVHRDFLSVFQEAERVEAGEITPESFAAGFGASVLGVDYEAFRAPEAPEDDESEDEDDEDEEDENGNEGVAAPLSPPRSPDARETFTFERASDGPPPAPRGGGGSKRRRDTGSGGSKRRRF